jgi:hypothetical protein
MYRKAVALAFCAVLFGALAVPKARADSDNIIVTTNQPLEVPGQVLSPGKYEFRPLDSAMDTGFFAVYTSDGKFIGNFPAIPDYRNHIGRTKIVLEKEPKSPERIKAWFYPGSTMGYEFLYPANTSVQLARVGNQTQTVNR